MSPEAFVLQGGNLALLAVVLLGIFRLIRDGVPLVRGLVAELGRIRTELATLGEKIDRLEGRGVCPMLASREPGARPTEPEVLRE